MWYDELSGYPRMSLTEALNLGYLSQDDYDYCKSLRAKPITTLYLSTEFILDFGIWHRMMPIIRTAEITDTEIKEWQEAWEMLKNLDFDAVVAKYKVKFDHLDDPVLGYF